MSPSEQPQQPRPASAPQTPFPAGPALLFCPGDRPDRFEKAAARADGVVLDLEDAVAPDAKASARESIVAASQILDPERTLVRISAAGTPEAESDLAALSRSGFRQVVLAKARRAEDVQWTAERLPGVRIAAQIESAAGVLAAGEIAAPEQVVALGWGSEDLLGSLGGRSSRRSGRQFGHAGVFRDVIRTARAHILLAAAAHWKAAIDAVHVDLEDLEGLAAEAEDAAASGFAATFCVHPAQVKAVRAAYAPTQEEVAQARRLVEAAREGAFRFEGLMIDAPLLAHAERVLRDAP